MNQPSHQDLIARKKYKCPILDFLNLTQPSVLRACVIMRKMENDECVCKCGVIYYVPASMYTICLCLYYLCPL